MRVRACLGVAALALAGWSWLALAAEPRRMQGEYVWNQRDKSGALEAVFTATGEAAWDVAFNFKFRDEDHVYTGTAEGNLTDGALSGRVQNENKTRTFVFRGSFSDGTFRGTHAEVEDGQATGTLSLRSAAATP